MRAFFVHILAIPSRTLYVGLTNNLERRVYEHKHRIVPGFTARYSVNYLVHIGTFAHIDDATAREKELKGWRRSKKLALIARHNPKWWDLDHCRYDQRETQGVTGVEAPGDRLLRSE